MNHTQVGIASPNPDFPSEVKTVTGENTIDIVGKNLLANTLTTQTINGITITINDNKTITINGTSTNAISLPIGMCNGLDSGNYTGDCANNSTTTSYYIRLGSNTSSSSGWIANLTHNTTFSLSEKTDVYAALTIRNGVTVNNVTIEPLVAKGSTAIDYEPYQSQSYELNLGSLELCKIGEYKDKIYKDSGKWYKHSEIGKVILNGSENWSKVNNCFQSTSASDTPNKGAVYLDSYSNNFTHKYYASDITSNMKNGEFGWNSGKLLTMRNDNCSTVSDFTSWLNNNFTSIYYPLQTSTEEEITNETLISQLEAVKLLSGTQNNFSIDANTLPTLNLNYIGEANPHL